MRQDKQAIFITDLGFGDAGKGTIVDFLARRCAAHTIVRYNGGPQAAHNVVDTTGTHHTFSQFASGMFVPGTRTLLSRFMLINPLNLLKEARHLNACGIPDALQRTQIDRRALVITPFQRAMNRLREIARGEQRHGSCGEGVGECMADTFKYDEMLVRAGDLADRALLRKKLGFIREAKKQELEEWLPLLPRTDAARQEYEVFTAPGCIDDCLEVYAYFSQRIENVDETRLHALFAQPGTLLFEGAQGVLLDENYGFTPYTTWSTTTFANADTLLQEHEYTGNVLRLGVTRTYMTRHGAGPLPSEDSSLAPCLPEPHNSWNDWQQSFRVGYYDLVATRYAREVAGKLDYLAVTHLDCLAQLPEWKFCTAYRYTGPSTDLAPFFQGSQDHLTGIKTLYHPDLLHQEHLTRHLQLCAPEYQTLRRPTHLPITVEDQATYLAYLSAELDVPIGLTSAGPTTRDKRCYHMPLDAIRTIA